MQENSKFLKRVQRTFVRDTRIILCIFHYFLCICSDKVEGEELVTLYLQLMYCFYLNIGGIINDNKLENVNSKVGFLENAIEFLQLINQAIKKMKELLVSVSINDMHEAVEFFNIAYQFDINNVEDGILGTFD